MTDAEAELYTIEGRAILLKGSNKHHASPVIVIYEISNRFYRYYTNECLPGKGAIREEFIKISEETCVFANRFNCVNFRFYDSVYK